MVAGGAGGETKEQRVVVSDGSASVEMLKFEWTISVADWRKG